MFRARQAIKSVSLLPQAAYSGFFPSPRTLLKMPRTRASLAIFCTSGLPSTTQNMNLQKDIKKNNETLKKCNSTPWRSRISQINRIVRNKSLSCSCSLNIISLLDRTITDASGGPRMKKKLYSNLNKNHLKRFTLFLSQFFHYF